MVENIVLAETVLTDETANRSCASKCLGFGKAEAGTGFVYTDDLSVLSKCQNQEN